MLPPYELCCCGAALDAGCSRRPLPGWRLASGARALPRAGHEGARDGVLGRPLIWTGRPMASREAGIGRRAGFRTPDAGPLPHWRRGYGRGCGGRKRANGKQLHKTWMKGLGTREGPLSEEDTHIKTTSRSPPLPLRASGHWPPGAKASGGRPGPARRPAAGPLSSGRDPLPI